MISGDLVKATGHIAILEGNLAPEGAVGKITGKEGVRFSGPARCFDAEEEMMAAVVQDPQALKGAVIVIRYEGPKGGPGMKEMLSPTSLVMGAGLGHDGTRTHPPLPHGTRTHPPPPPRYPNPPSPAPTVPEPTLPCPSRTHHRRPLLGRLARLLRGARRARGAGGGADRAGEGRGDGGPTRSQPEV